MKLFLTTIITTVFYLFSPAQPGAPDLSFDPGMGATDEARAIAIQSDGKIIIGGRFGFFDNYHVNHIARLHANGSLDHSFNTGAGFGGPDPNVYALAIQPDGKIIAGGKFISYDSVSSNHIMRINADGSPDTGFHAGTGFNDYVFDVAIQSDGKILAGGVFTEYNGVARNHLIRLNADGSIDNSFNIGTGVSGPVEAIAIQPADGKILIGGDFTFYGINPALRIARINTNGSYDASFNTVLGASSVVFDITVQDDGKILIGGNFTQYSFQTRNRIARLNSNGTIDANFDPVLGPDSEVSAIHATINYGVLLGGNFTSYNGAPVNRYTRILSDGLIYPDFNTGTGADGQIYAIEVQSDGRVLIAGEMEFYAGVSRSGIARIYNCFTPQPDSILGADSIFCPGEMIIYSALPVAGADRYEWTLPSGWTGSSDSVSITVFTNGEGGVISVQAFSDSCGYSNPQTKNIYRILPPLDSICLVTVDEQSTHNILIWEKFPTTLIDSFLIYRETTTNVYTRIASLPYDSLSEYHDYDANPNATSYRYRLSAIDICGVETAQSPFHNTIHLQNLGNGNFQWTFYQIEGASNPVTSFNVYRDPFSTGNFFPIGNVPGTNATFTDISHASFPNSQYVVDVNWSISCTPQRGTVNTTRSNIRKINFIDTIPTTAVASARMEDIVVYPNPSEGEVAIHLPASLQINHLQLLNTLGKAVWTAERVAGKEYIIPAGLLSDGIYFLAIQTHPGSTNKKVVIQQ